MVLAITVCGEDDQERGVLDDRQPRIVIGRELGDEVPEDLVPVLDERRLHAFADVDQATER